MLFVCSTLSTSLRVTGLSGSTNVTDITPGSAAFADAPVLAKILVVNDQSPLNESGPIWTASKVEPLAKMSFAERGLPVSFFVQEILPLA